MSDAISRIIGVTGPQPGVGSTNFKTGQRPPRQTRKYGEHAVRGSLDSPLSKSWLFEVVDRESGDIVESFTLILPPQSMSIKEPQRVSIQKTFGNAFVDDYGADNIQITLKGISGTTHAFPTFSTSTVSAFTDIGAAVSGASQASQNNFGFTGKNAFYEFRNKIMRYKDISGWDKRELRVYDLADEQAYKCVLLDFSLDRNSDNPLRYPFTISLFVYDKIDSIKVKKGFVVNISEDPITALDKVDDLIAKVQNLYQDVQSVLNTVAIIKARALELRSRFNRFLTQTTKIITSPLDVAKNLVDAAFAATGVASDAYRAGQYTYERYIGAQELLRETLISSLRTYGYQVSEGWQRSNSVELEVDNGVDTTGESVARSVSRSSYTYTGLRVYTVKGDDTLQRIAQNELGDSDLWPYIAAVNSDITSNNDLVPGEEIFIPIQVDIGEGTNKEQFILTEDIARDPYGTDIAIDQNGNLVVQESNDLATVSGLTNVEQAVNLRLNTMVGSMIKQTAFGITAQAGIAGTELAVKYLKTAVRNALTEDPRIQSIENMIVTLKADVLEIGMTVNVVGADKSLPVTVQT